MARECAGLVSDVDFNGAGGGLASLLLGDYQRPVTRLDLRLFQGVEVLALDVEPWTVSIFRDIEKIARHLRSVAGVGLQLADKGCGIAACIASPTIWYTCLGRSAESFTINGAELLLIASVVAVGVLHTMVPDHWGPIAILARQRGWTRAETARAAAQAGVGHVVTFILLLLGCASGARRTRFATFLSQEAIGPIELAWNGVRHSRSHLAEGDGAFVVRNGEQ